MSEKHTSKAHETAETVAKTVYSAVNDEMGRFLDEMQRTQERMFHEGERMVHEQQKLFDASLKMGKAMSQAWLESARRITGAMH